MTDTAALIARVKAKGNPNRGDFEALIVALEAAGAKQTRLRKAIGELADCPHNPTCRECQEAARARPSKYGGGGTYARAVADGERLCDRCRARAAVTDGSGE